MRELLSSRITFFWCLLVAATVVSLELGHGYGLDNPQAASVAVIVVAFVKVRFVLLEFMEIRHAPVLMRVIGEAWIIAVCVALVWLYLHPPH